MKLAIRLKISQEKKMRFLRKFLLFLVVVSWSFIRIAHSHSCTEIYDNAIRSVSNDSILRATTPLWESGLSVLALAVGGGAVIISPLLFLFDGLTPALKMGGTGLLCIGGGIACAVDAATSFVSAPIRIGMYQKIKNNLKKTRELLQEIEANTAGPYSEKLARLAGRENNLEGFFSELQFANFCPKLSNTKSFDDRGVFTFDSLKKIAAQEKTGNFDLEKHAKHIRFASKYSGIADERRYGFVGPKKVARPL
jgi:hypothetical protein